MVTALPQFARLDLDAPGAFVVGGHDIRRCNFSQTARELHERAGLFSDDQLRKCAPDLEAWSANVRPGTVLHTDPTIAAIADLPEAQRLRTPREAVKQIQKDLRDFRDRNQLDQVVMINVASTERPFELTSDHASADLLSAALDQAAPPVLPASSIYAYAAIDLGIPYVNFTPSLGASIPALEELARVRRVPVGGKDGKTGETLIKTVLAPLFAARNLRVLSWVGHNILGGGDGRVLNDPRNKESKV
jgi:myo-inositol-1-phosphate synthase